MNPSDSSPRGVFRLGWLLPIVTAAALLADMGARQLPIERFTFRAWETMAWGRKGDAPFRASAHYENASSYGDLASMGNLPSERRPHAEEFTTDAFGFRNLSVPERADVALVGDSFGVGAGVSDRETLSAKLEELTGLSVYNASGMPVTYDRLETLFQRLRMTRGTLLLQHLERALIQRRWTRGLRDRFPFNALENPFSASPLKIALKKAYRTVQDDRIFPNGSATSVERRTFPDGESILFYPPDLGSPGSEADADRGVERWLELSAWLEQRGITLAVVLVPSKFTVYGPLTTKKADVTAHRSYLNRLTEGLRKKGVLVTNLEPVYSDEARKRLPAKNYIYRLDDTHWNPEGIALGAREVAKTLPSSGN